MIGDCCYFTFFCQSFVKKSEKLDVKAKMKNCSRPFLSDPYIRGKAFLMNISVIFSFWMVSTTSVDTFFCPDRLRAKFN